MKSRVILAAMVAAAALGPLADMASAAPNRPMFVPSSPPPGHHPTGTDAAQRRAGSHYSIVDAELIRRCADLEGQFDRALTGVRGASWTRNAVALRAQGGAACSQGERQQGIDQLSTAVRGIGAIPYTTR